jgi:hypothetical protein
LGIKYNDDTAISCGVVVRDVEGWRGGDLMAIRPGFIEIERLWGRGVEANVTAVEYDDDNAISCVVVIREVGWCGGWDLRVMRRVVVEIERGERWGGEGSTLGPSRRQRHRNFFRRR